MLALYQLYTNYFFPPEIIVSSKILFLINNIFQFAKHIDFAFLFPLSIVATPSDYCENCSHIKIERLKFAMREKLFPSLDSFLIYNFLNRYGVDIIAGSVLIIFGMGIFISCRSATWVIFLNFISNIKLNGGYYVYSV